MARETAAERVDEFLEALPAAPGRVLLLDYDGTLAPFRVERDRATPYEGVRETVRELAHSGRTRVVVISGYAIPQVAQCKVAGVLQKPFSAKALLAILRQARMGGP